MRTIVHPLSGATYDLQADGLVRVESPAGPVGLFDVHGNVLEWCQDVYDDRFYLTPQASGPDPVNDRADEGDDRVLRGGPFNGKPEYCRCADRFWLPPDSAYKELGVRPAWPVRSTRPD